MTAYSAATVRMTVQQGGTPMALHGDMKLLSSICCNLRTVVSGTKMIFTLTFFPVVVLSFQL